MENYTNIQELSQIIGQLNLVADKQANLVMTNDSRIVTVQNLIKENELLFLYGFTDDDQPTTIQQTKLRDRLISLSINPNNLNASNIELKIQEEINNFYMQQGLPLAEITKINLEYNEDNLLLLISLFESKLEAIQNSQRASIVSDKTKIERYSQYRDNSKPRGSIRELHDQPSTSSIQTNKYLNVEATGQQKQIEATKYSGKLKINTNAKAYVKPHTADIQLFFTIKNKASGEYTITYNFDIMSILYLAKHLGKNNYSEDFWFNKLANFFSKTIGTIENDIDIPKISQTAYYRQVKKYTTKEVAEQALNDIKQQLIEQGLYKFSNIYKLNINNIKDRSTKNYALFSNYRKALKAPPEAGEIKSKVDTKKLFKHKKILSLADGYGIHDKTSEFLSKNLVATTTPINITAADKNCPPKDKLYNYEDNSNITIKRIQLDNKASFLYQKLSQERFDLVVMHRGCCHCESTSAKSISCGGIPMYAHEGLQLFLSRIASVLDITNKDTKAIITGKNVRELDCWKHDIEQFNYENQGNLVAEIARNSAGVFKGILIYNVS